MPAIDCEIKPKLCSRKEQIRIDRVLRETQHRAIFRKIAGDRGPRLAVVRRLQQIRFEIFVLVIVESRIDGVRVEVRRRQTTDIRFIGHARKRLVLGPVPAAIAGHLNQSVVSPNVDQPFFLRRFCKSHNIAVERSRRILRHRIRSPDSPHHG